MNETEINEMSIKCPACNTENTAKSIMKEIEIPHFGKVLETTIICESCGFKHSDIIALEQNDPAKYILKIKSFLLKSGVPIKVSLIILLKLFLLAGPFPPTLLIMLYFSMSIFLATLLKCVGSVIVRPI